MIRYSKIQNETKTKKAHELSCKKYWLQIYCPIKSKHKDALKYMKVYIAIDSPCAHKKNMVIPARFYIYIRS